jgi:hypothetical protein
MLLIVLTSIALYQTAFQGFVPILIYAARLSILFIVISSLCGAPEKIIGNFVNFEVYPRYGMKIIPVRFTRI